MTPADEAGFLEAIAADPADEPTRLAYADWLADRDDPRADFARLSADFLRSLHRLADARRAHPPEWLDTVDPLFARVRLLPVPDFGEGGDSVVVAAVHVAPGAMLSPGDPAVTVETEKASLDVQAEQRGVVLSALVRAGDRVRPGDPLVAFLAEPTTRPIIPDAWRVPGGPPLVPREPMLAAIRRVEGLANLSYDDERFAAELDHVRAGAELVFGPDEVEAAFLRAYCGAGWSNAYLPYLLDTMRGRGMSEGAIRRELVARHADALRYLQSKYGQPDRFAPPPGGA